MMFDIDSPDYEKDVVNWIKENIPFLEEECNSVSEMIISNLDFEGMVIAIAKINGTQVILLTLPGEDNFRVYYPKEIKTSFNERIDRYVVDDLFWFYRERAYNVLLKKSVIFCSFGMDMTMPFLSVH